MAKKEWFRKKSWSSADQSDFISHLERSCSEFHKAQYLRIQAFELQETGKRNLIRVSLDLLEILLRKYPSKYELASAHCKIGNGLEKLGDFHRALAAYQKAIAIEKVETCTISTAVFDYSWLIARLGFKKYYKEVLKLLNDREREGFMKFPSVIYLTNAPKALIFHAMKSTKKAATHAKIAIEAAHMEHSGFSYHPQMGLVTIKDRNAHAKLKKLARQSGGR